MKKTRLKHDCAPSVHRRCHEIQPHLERRLNHHWDWRARNGPPRRRKTPCGGCWVRDIWVLCRGKRGRLVSLLYHYPRRRNVVHDGDGCVSLCDWRWRSSNADRLARREPRGAFRCCACPRARAAAGERSSRATRGFNGLGRRCTSGDDGARDSGVGNAEVDSDWDMADKELGGGEGMSR